MPERTDRTPQESRPAANGPERLEVIPGRSVAAYRGLRVLAALAGLVSKRRSAQFRRSAEKRFPYRVTGGASADLKTAFRTLHGNEAIYFPAVTDPEVSVIVPAYRGLDDVLNCLRALALHRSTCPNFEVVLVDDCPSEPILRGIPRSGGLFKIANEQNLGFLRSCNEAAKTARGRVLCFLNSDTIVMHGWLRHLVDALDASPRHGLAGGMLINRDGTIQDAGWRILANGLGSPLGRGGDVRDGAHTYRREVDCVTGACLAIRRSDWQELGGFDETYAPAFYEEFDLAFRARERGLRTIYEPRCRVVHMDASSYGTQRRNELTLVNHATFCERFAGSLERQPTDASNALSFRSVRPHRPTILVVDVVLPEPDLAAGHVAMAGYLSMLASGGYRVIYAPKNGIADGPHAEALEARGIELVRAPMSIQQWLKYHGAAVHQVWLSRPNVAAGLIPVVRKHSKAPISYFTHDLHHVRLLREAELLDDDALRRTADRERVRELQIFRAVDRVLSPNDAESDLIRDLAPDTTVTTLPLAYYRPEQITEYDIAHFEPLRDLLFVGAFPHPPNVDAAIYMATEIMPLVWTRCPDARLVLVGHGPPPAVQALVEHRVIVTGQVPQVEPFFAQARLMLSALRYGAGVKGKVLDALRSGVPVVTTSIGAEGIGIVPGQDAVVAETAEELAEAVIALLGDPERCAALSRAGATLIRDRFSRGSTRKVLSSVFDVPHCRVCGSVNLRSPASGDAVQAPIACGDCHASAISEALAQVVVECCARSGETTLDEVLRCRPELRVLDLGGRGAISDTLQGWPNYSCTDTATEALGDFDVVLSRGNIAADPVQRVAEMARLLRPAGSIFWAASDNETCPDSTDTLGRAGLEVIEHTIAAASAVAQRPIQIFQATKAAR